MFVQFNYDDSEELIEITFDTYSEYLEWKHDNLPHIEIYKTKEIK
jgi:hypothetical protein